MLIHLSAFVGGLRSWWLTCLRFRITARLASTCITRWRLLQQRLASSSGTWLLTMTREESIITLFWKYFMLLAKVTHIQERQRAIRAVLPQGQCLSLGSGIRENPIHQNPSRSLQIPKHDFETISRLNSKLEFGATGNQKPHLVLNFDVNNTVVMLDSATGADSKGLIAMVLSNSAWGSIELDAEGQPISWTCQWSELTTEKLMAGLQTYTEFLRLWHWSRCHCFPYVSYCFLNFGIFGFCPQVRIDRDRNPLIISYNILDKSWQNLMGKNVRLRVNSSLNPAWPILAEFILVLPPHDCQVCGPEKPLSRQKGLCR